MILRRMEVGFNHAGLHGLQKLTFGLVLNQRMQTRLCQQVYRASLLARSLHKPLIMSLRQLPCKTSLLARCHTKHGKCDFTSWPCRAQLLAIGTTRAWKYDMPLPAGLPSITFGGELTQSMGEVTLLAGLRYLTLALFSTKHGNM